MHQTAACLGEVRGVSSQSGVASSPSNARPVGLYRSPTWALSNFRNGSLQADKCKTCTHRQENKRQKGKADKHYFPEQQLLLNERNVIMKLLNWESGREFCHQSHELTSVLSVAIRGWSETVDHGACSGADEPGVVVLKTPEVAGCSWWRGYLKDNKIGLLVFSGSSPCLQLSTVPRCFPESSRIYPVSFDWSVH